MESAEAPTRDVQPLDAAVLAAAVRKAVDMAAASAEPAKAIDAAVGALYEAVAGLHVSVFVLEHGRLWLVAQRGYAVVPDGIRVESGIMGRSVRLGRSQLVTDVRRDRDYLAALPGVLSELAMPLRAGRAVVGAINVESERGLPEDAAHLVRPLVTALSPRAEEVGSSRTLDLAGLARLFVYLGSLRDPNEIAALAAASLTKVLSIEASQVVLWDEAKPPIELAALRADDGGPAPLTPAELQEARGLVNPMFVCQTLERDQLQHTGRAGHGGSVLWLPLRANGEELGALIGVSAATTSPDPTQLDTASVLAAHVAASLDAAVVIERERQSAVTDPLTGILNRRGFEEHVEGVLGSAQEKRIPVSLLVMDCDDFKEINDRAGHEFGDALLAEVAQALERSLPEGAEAARLGGDEFVVVLPGAGVDAAQALGGSIRRLMSEGLTEAGFPLRISAGIATYPFDGSNTTTLLRAADQAMYAAKSSGKDCVASFRDVRRPEPATVPRSSGERGDERRAGPRTGGSILAETAEAAAAIEIEDSVEGVCSRLCKALVFIVGSTACSASRVAGDFLVDASVHALRDVSVGGDVSYRVSDFPLTAEALRTGEPRSVSFLDDDVDPAEAFLLRELTMNALLMIPLHVAGRPWGLVELYEMRLRRFTEDDVAIARFLATQAERRLEIVDTGDAPRPRLPVYELPADDAASPGPRTR